MFSLSWIFEFIFYVFVYMNFITSCSDWLHLIDLKFNVAFRLVCVKCLFELWNKARVHSTVQCWGSSTDGLGRLVRFSSEINDYIAMTLDSGNREKWEIWIGLLNVNAWYEMLKDHTKKEFWYINWEENTMLKITTI